MSMGRCFVGSSEHSKVRRREKIRPSQPREEDPWNNEQPPVAAGLLCAGLRSQDFQATVPCAPPSASMRWLHRGALRKAGTPARGRAHTSQPQLWRSACLLQLSVGFPEAVPIGQHPHPPVGHGMLLASRQWPAWSQRESNAALHC